MRIRLYPKSHVKSKENRPMLFSDIDKIKYTQGGNGTWTIAFEHVDHIHKTEDIRGYSVFSSEHFAAFTLLCESYTDTLKAKKILEGEKN